MRKIILIVSLCLTVTIVIEFLVALLLKIRNKKDLLNIMLVNVLTNPIIVSIGLYLGIYASQKTKILITLIMEVIVVLVEALIYKKYLTYKKISPIFISIILNFSSWEIGELIKMFLYEE